MKNLKVLILLLLIVTGISFAAGRSNKTARDKRGIAKNRITDAKDRKYCGRDENNFGIECKR